jgi:signal peptidase I
MDNDMRPAPTPTTSSTPVEASPAVPSASTPTGTLQPPNVEPMPPSPEPAKSNKLKSVLSTLLILLVAPLLAIFITMFVFQSYQVDGQSMETTLQDNDRLIIWKLPRSWARLTNNDYQPKRGDIIVFVKRGMFEDSSGKEKQLVKRVIGLPGDRVVVKDGVMTVYNEEHPDGFSPDATLPYGKTIDTVTDGNVDVTVGAGEVFVCGDNRGNSQDSRFFGPIPEGDIVGKLVARILPFNKADRF